MNSPAGSFFDEARGVVSSSHLRLQVVDSCKIPHRPAKHPVGGCGTDAPSLLTNPGDLMALLTRLLLIPTILIGMPGLLLAQEAGSGGVDTEALRQTADEIAQETQQKVNEIAEQVDQSEQAKEVSAGLLQPIYALAEAIAFPSFYWVAFMLMVAGVISFALQLVFGKLVVLSKMSLSLREIISDGVGLVISLIGLVLTTQAATENSTFTESPAAVLSSAGVGLIVGFILYRWGQATEVEAAQGRKIVTRAD